MPSLDQPLSSLPTIKKLFLSRFEKLGIRTVRDLLFHIPSRYEDYAASKPIADALEGEKATFEGVLGNFRTRRTPHRGMILVETTLRDATGEIQLLWFNQKHIAENFASGASVRVSGTPSANRNRLIIKSPTMERSNRRPTHTGRIVPVYPETYGLTSRFIRWQIELLFEKQIAVPDPIPEHILSKLHLPTISSALRMAHFPRNEQEPELARKRLAFDSMFLVQLKSLEIRNTGKSARAIPFQKDTGFLDRTTTMFPFSLTDAQKRTAEEILNDLAKPTPMNRLVNGDVGSGKTAVAAIAARRIADGNFQTALLAPTESLARQHYETFTLFFSETPHTIALLTRSMSFLGKDEVSHETLKNAIRAGLASVVIGTQALLEPTVSFNNLALVVVDEQHRFGVRERSALQEATRITKDGIPETVPHFLTMTATPIPRTLALGVFGALDLSLLDELPKRRAGITTRITTTKQARETVFRFARQEIKKGRQIFVILPLVEESAALSEVKAATTEYEKLKTHVFPDFEMGLLHGRLKSAEKERVMHAFKNSDTKVLVSTSVVEVGIDVPNATVIIIENADRFGLSQLHQFRGRVGRGTEPSYCFLLPGNGASSNERLAILTETMNGFDIAEKDLELRGPGAFFGTRQSGLPDSAMEHLGNTRLIKIARDEAEVLLNDDPSLARHPLLRTALDALIEEVHME